MVVETFTGMRPFTGQTTEQALAALLHSEYHLPGTSPEIRTLDAIVQRCIAKDPRDRYGSAAELATDLIPNLAGCAVVRAPGATGRPTRRRSDRSIAPLLSSSRAHCVPSRGRDRRAEPPPHVGTDAGPEPSLMMPGIIISCVFRE